MFVFLVDENRWSVFSDRGRPWGGVSHGESRSLLVSTWENYCSQVWGKLLGEVGSEPSRSPALHASAFICMSTASVIVGVE